MTPPGPLTCMFAVDLGTWDGRWISGIRPFETSWLPMVSPRPVALGHLLGIHPGPVASLHSQV